jgi:hypothetical protein
MNAVAPPERPLDAPHWEEAWQRVESYLHAHGLEQRLPLVRLTDRILTRAVAASARETGVPPVTLALREADAAMADWFARVLEQPPETAGTVGDRAATPALHPRRLSVRGRIALAMAGVPARWPRHFLADEPPPPELVAAMRSAYLEAGPPVQFSNMAASELELGPLADAAGETWERLRRWPLVGAALGWVAFVALLGFLFYATR